MKRAILILLPFTISSGLLYFILCLTPIEQIFRTLASATLTLVLTMLCLSAIGQYLNARQMKIVTESQGMPLSTFQIFHINLTTSFYELFLPGIVAGGAIRWYKLTQRNRMRIEALAAMGFNRLANWLVLPLVGIFCWVMAEKTDSTELKGSVGFLLLMLAFLLVVYGLLVNTKLLSFLARYLQRTNLLVIPSFLQNKCRKVVQALERFQFLPRHMKLRILGLCVSRHALGVLEWYLLALSLSLTLSVLQLGWVRSCVNVLTLVPLSIAGLGIREGSLSVLLPPNGVTLSEAVALAFLLLLVKVFWGLIGGMLEAWNLLFLNGRKIVAKQVVS